MKTLILTSVSGGKDILKDPSIVFSDCDYYAFVDKIDDNLHVWNQIINYSFSRIDGYVNRRNAKVGKILTQTYWNHYDYIIWHDATHELVISPNKIYWEYKDFDILCFRHAQRRCLYQELDAINQMDSSNLINEQRNFYQKVGMPPYFGLWEMGCYIRKVNKATIDFGLMWFEQICKFTSRDQVSFAYCVWQMQDRIKIKEFKGNCSKYMGTSFENEGNIYFNNHSNHIK